MLPTQTPSVQTDSFASAASDYSNHDNDDDDDDDDDCDYDDYDDAHRLIFLQTKSYTMIGIAENNDYC